MTATPDLLAALESLVGPLPTIPPKSHADWMRDQAGEEAAEYAKDAREHYSERDAGVMADYAAAAMFGGGR